MSNLETALAMAGHALPVFPCDPKTKAPLIKEGFKAASFSPLDVRAWWKKFPDALIGVPTGVPSGIVAIDFDATPEAEAWLLTHDSAGARVHKTRRAGGEHHLYKMPEGEDLRCGTNVLAKGIDVRANGGYIIWWPAHGCEFAGPRVVDLPEMPKHVRSGMRSAPVDTPAEVPTPVTTATLPASEIQGLLATFNPDCGYDEWSRLGMAVHSACGGAEWGFQLWNEWSRGGSKYKSPADLRTHWKSFKSDGGVTAGLLLAQSTAPVDAFDVLEPEAPAVGKLQCVDALELVKPIEWILEGFLPKCEVFVLYGAPKSGKSYALLDMALAISRDQPWHDAATKGGVVVWVTAEGNRSTRRRIEAYKKREQCALPNFYIYNDAPQLSRQDDVKALCDAVKPLEPALILIDALIGVTRGIDENDRKMGEVLQKAATFLNTNTGATVGVIHHAGKDQSKGMRGSTAILGVVEASLRVHKDKSVTPPVHCVILEEGRDVEDGKGFYFTMEDDANDGVILKRVEAPTKRPLGPKGGVQQIIFDLLQEHEVITVGEARAAVRAAFPDRTPESERKAWHQTMKSLEQAAWVRVNDDQLEKPDTL